jgi:hypothetical protein
VIILFLATSAIACIVTIPIYFIIKYFNTKYFHLSWLKLRKLKISIGLFTILIASYLTYTAFYPSDSFFEDEFESNTNIQFPKSGEVLVKGASYPDIHGDYSSSAIISVNENDFKLILKKIQKNKNFRHDTCKFAFCGEIRKKVKKFSVDNFTNLYAKIASYQQSEPEFFIAFDSKNKIISYERNSW